MNQFEMIALIVAIVMIARFARDRNRLRFGRDAEQGALQNDALVVEVARLRDRVEVLERLATDKGRRLADEIESLRS